MYALGSEQIYLKDDNLGKGFCSNGRIRKWTALEMDKLGIGWNWKCRYLKVITGFIH